VVLCTPSMHAAYAHLFAHAESRLHLVTNGFDEADYRDAPERPTRDRPLLLYCGRFSGIAERSPDLLLRALRTVVDAGREIQLEILGDNSEAVRRSIQRLGLRDFVRTHAPVPHAEAVRAMRMADILVVCQPPSRNGVSATAGKTYEYLRCGLPVLALVPEGDNADLVRRYAPVHAVVTTGDAGAAAAAILHLLDAVRGAPAPDPGFLENYNRRRIAERIAGIFDAALKTALRPPTP